MASSGRRLLRNLAAISSLAVVASVPALADEAPADPSAASPAGAATPGGQGGPEVLRDAAPSALADLGGKVFDAAVLRPLSACAVVVGGGAFLASLPLVGPHGQLEAIRTSWEYFAIGPVDYTFVRPLGDF